jgi:hypothetical protein
MSLYSSSLRATLRATAAAYGYTLTIATTAATLISTKGPPRTGEVYLFVAGGLVGFALLEALLHVLPSRGDERPQQAFPFAGALNLLSVSVALGGGDIITHIFPSATAWFVASMVATMLYMLLVAVQVALVDVVRSG